MGFDLRCVFTVDADVFALFDKVIPGGSGYALRTGGKRWPDGWVLPVPWELEDGLDGKLAMVPGALEPTNPDAWRAAAGIPGEPDPLGAFDDPDLQLGSLLSLAAPVVVIDDSSFGGILGHEFAALFVDGELLTAYGVDYLGNRAFELNAGTYHAVDAATVEPTTQCAELIDSRFSGRLLYGGYLPREARRDGSPCRETGSDPVPSISAAWREHFQVFGSE
jgi:hypothetical protein